MRDLYNVFDFNAICNNASPINYALTFLIIPIFFNNFVTIYYYCCCCFAN